MHKFYTVGVGVNCVFLNLIIDQQGPMNLNIFKSNPDQFNFFQNQQIETIMYSKPRLAIFVARAWDKWVTYFVHLSVKAACSQSKELIMYLMFLKFAQITQDLSFLNIKLASPVIRNLIWMKKLTVNLPCPNSWSQFGFVFIVLGTKLKAW